MRIKITIDGSSDAGELVATADFIKTLALHRGAHVAVGPKLTAPIDEAELDEPEVTVIVPLSEVKHDLAPVKRTRRTRVEMAAAEAAAAATPEPEVTPLVEPPAPTPPAPQQDTPPSETASTAPVSASPSDIPTPAQLNAKAAVVKNKIGPEKIRDHIKSMGADLISQLDPAGRVAFDAWLDAQ